MHSQMMDRSSIPNTPSARRGAAFDFHATRSYPTTPGAGGGGGGASSSNLHKESYREAVAQIHATIYNGKGKDRDAVEEVIDRYYDHSATFETPLTVSIGKQRIADQFGLMALMPGEVHSEVQDVCESQDYHGNRSVLLTHTLHFNLNPLASREEQPNPPNHAQHHALAHGHAVASHPHLRRLQSSASWQDFCRGSSSHYDAWTSYAPTPAATVTPGLDLSPTNDHNSEELSDGREPRGADIVYEPSTRHPSTSRAASLWTPFTWIFSPIKTSSRVINKFTDIHLKILTRLDFNEFDRVFHHEDTYSVKDILEGIPLLRPIYYLNRRLLAYSFSTASHVINDNRLLRAQHQSRFQHTTRLRDEEQARSGNITPTPVGRTDSGEGHPVDAHSVRPSTPSMSTGLQLDLRSLLQQQEIINFATQPSYHQHLHHHHSAANPLRPSSFHRTMTSDSVPTTMDPDHL